jgi:threonine aldolase
VEPATDPVNMHDPSDSHVRHSIEAHPSLVNLPRPLGWFGSDNQSGAHPLVLEAVQRANAGYASGYGEDPWTEQAVDLFRERFGSEIDVLFTYNGTGANVTALQALLPKWGAVICPAGAHIDVDETGAPEKILGAKLIDVPTPDGKLRPEQINEYIHFLGVQHHVQPAVVSITQSTELGTLYTVDEIAQIAYVAHSHGMLMHLDGARISNAVAALGCSPEAMTFGAGVDAVSFGGTKNGLMFGEAVLFKDRTTANGAVYLRKQTTQLASKMRFLSAQMIALLTDDLWLQSAGSANAMALRLDQAVRSIPGVQLDRPTVVNSLFPIIPQAAIAPLQEWVPHYTWNEAINQVRWVCSFDTTPADVDHFAAGISAVLTSLP